ncbi:MAG: cytochrome P450 [Pseudomonas sp.]|uniref:cytochrome P450 n=1 Tax=Pseudomonas sp. TaxID=306 RepID=UPI003394B0D5
MKGPRRWLLGLDHLLRIHHDQLGFYQQLAHQYGDVVPLRLGPYRSWVLFHPDQVQQVLVTEADAFVRFEPVMGVLAQWNGASLLIAEGEAWKVQRRKVLPAFQPARFAGYAEQVVARSLALRERWLALADGRELQLDMDAAMVELTLELACKALFGTVLGETADIGRAVALLSDIAFAESLQPLRLPDWLPTQQKRAKAWAIQVMERTVRQLVEARRAEGGRDQGDLLSMLLAHYQGESGDRQVRDEAMTLLIAGHETTGAALSWICHLLAENQEACMTLQAELDLQLAGRPPVFADLRRLPYLEAVVKEALRLYPPAYSLFLRRAIRPVRLGELHIRRGELVQIVPWVIQRDPRWFESPDSFRPQRFLDPEQRWPKQAYLPFGSGPRVCVGQSFGMMEMLLVTAVLLQRLTPLSCGVPVVPQAKFSLRPAGGLPLRWHCRAVMAG